MNTSSNRRLSETLTFLSLLTVAILFLASFCVFFVYEGQTAIVQRFGRINKDSNGNITQYAPGLHVIIPFIDQVSRIDVRKQLLSVPSDRIYTSEQKTVTVDYFTVWRVVDPAAFYLKLAGDYNRAESFLRGKINDTLRVEIGKREVNEVITGQRGDIIDSLRANSQSAVTNLGLEILDVRISRVDYPQEVSESVFKRMQAAREKEASMYRSEGDQQSEIIRASGDAERVTILAKANQASSEIMAQGDAEAATVFNKAYDKNKGFFDLLRTLDVYKSTIRPGETMLVDMELSKIFGAINKGPVLHAMIQDKDSNKVDG